MRVIWYFLELAATAILLAAALVFFLNLAAGGYFASRAGQGGEEFLFLYTYPAIISAVVIIAMLLQLPSRMLLCIGFYPLAERLYRSELAVLNRLPGPKWFWTMGTKGKLADVLAVQGKDEEADKVYAEVGLLSKDAGLFSSVVVGSSLENYAERLARADKLIDYAEWKGKFRGANIARRILTLLWVALTVVAMQLSLKYMKYQVPLIASNLSYLGRYELADSILTAQLGWYADDRPNSPELAALRVRIAENDIRWGRFSEAEQIYLELLPLKEIDSGKLDTFFQSQPVALTGLRDFANLELKRGKFEDAEKLYRKILSLSERVIDRLSLADCLLESGKTEEARAEYQRSLAACAHLNDKDAAAALSVSAEMKLARLYLKTGQTAEAEKHAASAFAKTENNTKTAVDQALAATLLCMEIAYRKGEGPKADELKFKAMQLGGAANGEKEIGSLATASRLHQIAVSLKNAGQTAGLDQLFKRISDSVAKLTDSSNPALTSYMLDRAEVAIQEKRYADAESLCTQALAELVDRGLGNEHPAVLRAYVRLGESQSLENKKSDSAQSFERALNIIQSRQNPRIPDDFMPALKRFNARISPNNATTSL